MNFFTESVLRNNNEYSFIDAFNLYQDYIRQNEFKFPRSLLELLRSDWYFNARDPRCPKDSWLVKQGLVNGYDPVKRIKTGAEFEIVLLGAYHDCYLHYRYNEVVELKTDGHAGSLLQKDYDSWRIDEFSIDGDGLINHRICFLSGIIWSIKCKSINFNISNI